MGVTEYFEDFPASCSAHSCATNNEAAQPRPTAAAVAFAAERQCDPYSLYVQLSRSRSLDGIMLLSKARERDIIGNMVPENMVAAEKELSEATIREAE